MTAEILPRRQAAALVLALGSQRAARVLEHLAREEVEILADEVASLAELDHTTRSTLIRDVLARLGESDPVAEAATIRARARQLPPRVLLDHPEFDVAEPFAFLTKVELTQAVQFLAAEHPQTVAVVLSHQPPALAGKILSAFDDDVAGDVALRIAAIGRTPPHLMAVIEEEMRRRLTEAAVPEAAPLDGERDLASILNTATQDLERAVLDRLSEADPALAERVRSLMFVFEDIVTLSDRAVQQVLTSVDTRTLALALKGAPETVRETVFRNLSQRARDNLAEEIDLLGSVRRSEVLEARAALVAEIRVLEEAGRIVISRGDAGELID